MAGTAASMAGNMAALAAAAANVRAIMQAGVAGALLAAPLVGEEAVNTIQQLINVQGPPRSSPGEPPHMDTGELYDSYDYEVEDGGTTITLVIGSSALYAPFLEFGTSKMDARPHMRPALETLASGARITTIIRYSVAAAQSAALGGMGGSG